MPAALRAAPQPTFPAHNPQPTALTLSSLVCPTCIRKSHRQHRAGFALQSHKGPRLAVANYSFTACLRSFLRSWGLDVGSQQKPRGWTTNRASGKTFYQAGGLAVSILEDRGWPPSQGYQSCFHHRFLRWARICSHFIIIHFFFSLDHG